MFIAPTVCIKTSERTQITLWCNSAIWKNKTKPNPNPVVDGKK